MKKVRKKKPQTSASKRPRVKAALPPVNVAVIGDVMTDWSFVSNEPRRPRLRQLKPWTRDPSTHIFRIPGGAWYSGHMIQGALADPVFMRQHGIELSAGDSNRPTHIALRGSLSKEHSDPSNEFCIAFGDTVFDIIVNDEIAITSKALKSLRIRLPQEPSKPAPQLEIGLTNAAIEIGHLKESLAGYFSVDQVSRCYNVEDVEVKPQKLQPLQCTYFTIFRNGISIVDAEFEDGISAPWTADSSISSVRIVTPLLRRGEIWNLGSFTLQEGLTLKITKGQIENTYGRLIGTTRTIDEGKLPSGDVSRQLAGSGSNQPLPIQLIKVPTQGGISMFAYDEPAPSVSVQHSGHLVYTLSELGRFRRHARQKGDMQVFRRCQLHGVSGPQHGYPTILSEYSKNDKYVDLTSKAASPSKKDMSAAWPSPNAPSVVCVDDQGLGFNRRHDAWCPFLYPSDLQRKDGCGYRQWQDEIESSDGAAERIQSHLSNTWIIIKLSHWIDPNRFELLDFLTRHDALRRVILIMSGDSLRMGLADSLEKPGIKLAKTVSWERTVEDFGVAIREEKLKPFVGCRDIIVRLGLEGALHRHVKSDKSVSISLIYDTKRIEGEYTGSALGAMPGQTTVVMAAVAQAVALELSGGQVSPSGATLTKSVSVGLQSARRYFDIGYGPTATTIGRIARLQLPISQIFGRDRIVGMRDEGIHRFQIEDVTDGVSQSSWNKWSILKRRIQSGPANGRATNIDSDAHKKAEGELFSAAHNLTLQRAIYALQLGRAIVLRGPEAAFDGDGGVFPYMKLGGLLAVDRNEIQGLRAIRDLLAEYVRHAERRIPISFAVFGPPGSGKSFAVKQIADCVTENKLREFSFNLAQFNSFSELTRQLLKVRDSALNDETPLVFFDEFDCRLDNRKLGWLKYFLAPMQDGMFQHAESMLGLGKSILVFAGGIASTYGEFSSPQFWEKDQSAADTAAAPASTFKAAKGPDFHSRLRGFLDILGPNPNLIAIPSESDLTGADGKDPIDRFANDDFTFVIRRAILVRSNIERLHRSSSLQLLDSENAVEMDLDLLDAMLLVDRYKHGVRSIQALFEMSTIQGHGSLSKTAIPSRLQYGMHVDHTFFHILLREYGALGSGILSGVFKFFRETEDDMDGDGDFRLA